MPRPPTVTQWERRYQISRNTQSISLSRTSRQLEQLPHDINRWTELRVLSIPRSSIRELPARLSALPHLEELYINSSTLTSLSPIQSIPSLRKIRFSAPNVREFPYGFDRLQLEEIDLKDSPIKSFEHTTEDQLRLMFRNTTTWNRIRELPPVAGDRAQSAVQSLRNAKDRCAANRECRDLHELYATPFREVLDRIQHRPPTDWEFVRLCHQARDNQSYIDNIRHTIANRYPDLYTCARQNIYDNIIIPSPNDSRSDDDIEITDDDTPLFDADATTDDIRRSDPNPQVTPSAPTAPNISRSQPPSSRNSSDAYLDYLLKYGKGS